jgi:hypothetical protein
MEVYVDPQTGREYAVDPATGRSHWLNRPQAPNVQQTQELTVIPAASVRRTGRTGLRALGAVAIVVVLVAGLVLILSSRGDQAGPTSAPSRTSGQGAARTDAGLTVPGVGTPVRDGKFEFRVTGKRMTKKLGNDLVNITTDGEFLLVSVTVRNISDQDKTFVSIAQKLHDTKGREYTANARATLYLGQVTNLLDTISPGDSVHGTLVFDLPAGASPERVELHDGLLSNGAEVRLR